MNSSGSGRALLSAALVFLLGGAVGSCRYMTSLDGYSSGESGGFGGTEGDGGGTGGSGADSGKPDTGGTIGDVKIDEACTGNCNFPCSTTQVDCNGNEADGCEVDLLNNGENCGTCGHNCQGGGCSGGTCGPVAIGAQNLSVAWALGIDGTNVYFTMEGPSMSEGEVWKMDKAGNSPSSLANHQNSPVDLQVDATSIYWTNYTNGGGVKSASLQGTNQQSPGTGCGPWGLAQDSLNIYWTCSNGTIIEYPKNGGTSQSTIVDTTGTSGDEPRGLAVYQGYAYWTTFKSGRVMRAKTDGTQQASPEELFSAQAYASGIAVSAAGIFWTNAGSWDSTQGTCSKNDGQVMSSPLPPQAKATAIASNQACPLKVTVDNKGVYWTAEGTYANQQYQGDGSVWAAPFEGSPAQLASGQTVPYGIAVDDTAIYWTIQGLGTNSGGVMKVVR